MFDAITFSNAKGKLVEDDFFQQGLADNYRKLDLDNVADWSEIPD